MKKVKFEGKLNLNKETVAKLTDAQMRNVQGGSTVTTATNACTATCLTDCAQPSCQAPPTVTGHRC
jgi:natural product precursor